MIRSDERFPAAVQLEIFQGEQFVEIKMIQVKKRDQTRVSPGVAQEHAGIDALEIIGHHP
jgi:hypothetical protein